MTTKEAEELINELRMLRLTLCVLGGMIAGAIIGI
jgi:hypothetical protein